ncbi:hypothetical protein Bca4012_030773 [Brassica carinata]
MDIHHQNDLLVVGLNPCSSSSSPASIKAKIMALPHYHRLFLAYSNCQKGFKLITLSRYRRDKRDSVSTDVSGEISVSSFGELYVVTSAQEKSTREIL